MHFIYLFTYFLDRVCTKNNTIYLLYDTNEKEISFMNETFFLAFESQIFHFLYNLFGFFFYFKYLILTEINCFPSEKVFMCERDKYPK